MKKNDTEEQHKSSESLAVIISDTLVRAGYLNHSQFESAKICLKKSLDSRKAIRDYYSEKLSSVDLAMILSNELIEIALVDQSKFSDISSIIESEIDIRKDIGLYE